jgi:hypothetical protein
MIEGIHTGLSYPVACDGDTTHASLVEKVRKEPSFG